MHQAAAFLGAHVQTIRKLARSGALPSFKVGKDWRFRREALERWTHDQRPGMTPCSVLVIDDEKKVCTMLIRMVQELGCVGRATTSAIEGLAMVEQETPDLILLDLKMPDMSGPSFLRTLRETHPTLPVAVVTGYPDSELMREAMLHAPVLLLAKPVERLLLERTVRTLVGDRGGGVRRTGT